MKRSRSFHVIIASVVLVAILGLFSFSIAVAQAAGIIAVAWSPDGSKIAVGGVDGLLRILDTEGVVIRNITGTTVQINTVDWSPDSTKIVSGSDDGSVFIWDVNSGQKIATLVGAGQYLWTVDWSPDGTKILGSGFKNIYTLIVWDASTYQQLATQNAGDSVDAEWSPDSTKIACANSAGYLNIFTSLLEDTNTYFTINDGKDYGPVSVSWSPDGRKIATGSTNISQSKNSFNFDIKVWDFATGKLHAIYTGYTDIVDAVAFSPDGQQLASASRDGSVRIWNTVAGQQIASFPKAKTYVSSIAWSPDGTRLAYGSGRSGLQIVSIPINVTYTPGPPPTATSIPPTISAQTLQSFLQPSICTRTCFMGLQPDMTTQAELENWIIQHDVYISTDKTFTDYEGKIRREVRWAMDNPTLAVASSDQIGVTANFIEDTLVSIKTSMNIPAQSILEAYGQPSFLTYFQYVYYAVYPKQKVIFSFPENLSYYYEANTVQLMLGNDAVVDLYSNPSAYFPVKKCTGDNAICTTIQTATPYPKF